MNTFHPSLIPALSTVGSRLSRGKRQGTLGRYPQMLIWVLSNVLQRSSLCRYRPHVLRKRLCRIRPFGLPQGCAANHSELKLMGLSQRSNTWQPSPEHPHSQPVNQGRCSTRASHAMACSTAEVPQAPMSITLTQASVYHIYLSLVPLYENSCSFLTSASDICLQ